MANIIAYEYESTFVTTISASDLADFASVNNVISYEVYDGSDDPENEDNFEFEEDE